MRTGAPTATSDTMSPMDFSPTIGDRAASVLLGQAIGDALGVPYKFAAPISSGEARMKGGGLGPYAHLAAEDRHRRWSARCPQRCIGPAARVGGRRPSVLPRKWVDDVHGGPACAPPISSPWRSRSRESLRAEPASSASAKDDRHMPGFLPICNASVTRP